MEEKHPAVRKGARGGRKNQVVRVTAGRVLYRRALKSRAGATICSEEHFGAFGHGELLLGGTT
jgi:hypothetical protein